MRVESLASCEVAERAGRLECPASTAPADRHDLWLVGFRNVLVHQYTTVDDDIVLASLDQVGELREFVRQVSGWMTR